jgi:radical SAM-linked protein
MKGDRGVPVRLKYRKVGKIRWISHRDVARALERSFRIAELPLAFSEGFSPRPRVSFGLALATGHESEAEYVDLVLAESVAVDTLAERLNPSLPEGMEIVGAVPLVDRAPALQEAVTFVEWTVEIEPVADVRERVATGLQAASLETTRRRKGREVVEDVRPVIRSIVVRDDTTLEMQLNTQPRSAKPGEVLTAISDHIGSQLTEDTLVEVRALRTHQWIERDGARQEPLDADTRPCAPEARAS